MTCVDVASLEQEVRSLTVKVELLEGIVADHAQRFSTAQSRWLKRLIVFWLWEGWPMHDWNADKPAWRPWR